jgi:hypothetical protein
MNGCMGWVAVIEINEQRKYRNISLGEEYVLLLVPYRKRK